MAYKLIVVESSPTVQKVIQISFPDSEFEIYPFQDGIEVIESLSDINPDALLLSLSLPDKDGYEIGLNLKSLEELKEVPLILLKGAFESIDNDKIVGLDYDVIIQEPFDSEELVQIVRDLIERKKDPQTLPEEQDLDKILASESEHNHREKNSHKEMPSQNIVPSNQKDLQSFPSDWKAQVEEIVRGLMNEEILNVERELEKRVRTQILLELKGKES